MLKEDFRKILKKRAKKTSGQNFRKISVFVFTVVWLLTGWPGFWQKPRIPILLDSVYAAVTTYSTGSGTYTVPAGTTMLVVELWGGGGGGAGGSSTINGYGNGGGGGGAYAKKTITSPASSYSYSVGAGGAAVLKGLPGNNGGDTTFGSTLVVAKGGSGGAYSASGGGAGGAGGTGSTGDATYTGGSGAAGSTSYAGGGGGGAGSGGNGGNASGTTAGTGTSELGGNGGTGVTGNNVNGNSGNNYGGGGSGGTGKNGGGGAGADGYIRISNYIPATVTTQDASNISYTSVTGNGNITDSGEAPTDPATVTRRGFCYMVGTTGDPTTANSVAYDDGSFSTGSYTKSITGLTPGTNYRVRAYAVTNAGTSYGTTVQVTTLNYSAPTVTTNAVSDVSYTTATANGDITSDGGSTITRRGFCYMVGTSGDCTTADSVVYEDGSFTTGTYSRGLSGLSSGTGYRVRAYAVNSSGTGYGSTVQLTTLNYSPTTVLNSPPDLDSTTDTTPTFNFTATDAESNPVEYNFQLDTTTTFDSQAGSPLLNKVSTTDAGFTAGHPYSSGSATEFTVQSGDALTPGTYYWRTRAIDPTGSNTYGSFPTYRTLTITSVGVTLGGTVYQTDGSTAYDCSANNLTIYLRVNGSGTYSTTCTLASGSWGIPNVTVTSGQTVYSYIYGETPKGSSVLVSNSSAVSDIPIIQDRVVLRDDVNSSITNTEVLAGNTADSDDLITTSGTDVTVGSSYTTHIYTGDTYAPGANVSTGKLRVVGNYSGSTETLTLTGSGTGTSRPLYVDTGTFTVPSTVQFQGTSATDINALTYNTLNLNPTLTAGTTYTFLGAASANGNFTINPTAASSYSLSVNLGGEMTVAPTGTTTIQGTTSGIGVLNTTASNYTLTTGKVDIASGGVLTANDSNIYLTGTSSTLFTKTGTFNEGTSNAYMQPGSSSPTLTSGTVTFYDLTINMSGQTGATGGNTTVGNNLTVTAGTLSIPSTYTLSVTGNTDITGSLSISSTGNQTFTGTTTINSGGSFSRTSATGTNTFTGLLTVSSGGQFTTTSDPAFTLQGGISNSGSFSSGAGTFTFNTNGQTLSGSSAITFGGAVAISGAITVQNSNTEKVTITGDLTGTEAGSTYQNNANATTDFKGAVLATGTLTATADNNKIYYTRASAQTVKATTYHDLYIQPSANTVTTSIGVGTLTVTGDLTIGNGTNTGVVIEATTNDPNISVTGALTVANGTTFTNSDLSTATLNIDGNLTINSGGTFTAPVGTSDTSFTLAGNFTNNGTFNHNNGQITLDTTGTSQLSYSSATSFYQFSVLSASAGKPLQFDETDPTIITNDITIQGSNCTTGRISLDSLVNDSPWEINIKTGATQNIDYIDLEDANGTLSEVTPTADNSTETGTNTGWTVNAGVCTPTANTTNFTGGINLSGININ